MIGTVTAYSRHLECGQLVDADRVRYFFRRADVDDGPLGLPVILSTGARVTFEPDARGSIPVARRVQLLLRSTRPCSAA